ncbi:amidohydrolase family protein [Phenylobacterium sp. 20VBR1]|uniref:Amidohydrolase family protein n=1 Tax=Phenylobacterium glaciei TaxID=2803784 RepID=A0A941D1W1_9CAUL|nr:amidohydrolase family protein [Phenylobacterium glaciei]MBR7619959.1 amidohydrolase family protein [Phenylobacterium glaciei]
MAYAPAHRAFYDADSHIMELPDFLKKYADPKLRDEIPEVSYSASLVTDEEVAVIVAQGSRHSPEHIAAQIALGDRLIESSKEIQALGAFDAGDRSRALDLLGFKKQLVFATHSVALPFSASSRVSPELRYGATRAHNRHMADFCGGDDRLLGVAIIPLDEPSLAIAELDAALAAGLKAVWIPHRTPGERSPGHIDFDPFWARLAESGTPFLLHVGGAPLQQAKAWMNNGRGLVADWMGGGENLRSKDIAILHQGPETFLSVMLIDGVFERFPGLRGASVELGAGWVPSLLTRLDWVAKNWIRADKNQTPFSRRPSEMLSQQMAFTPFVFEDVGVLIDQSSPELYLFSSDYPHVEGGRDPIKRFEGFLGDRSEAVRDAFYAENFLRIFPGARVLEPARASAGI